MPNSKMIGTNEKEIFHNPILYNYAAYGTTFEEEKKNIVG